MTNAKPVRRPFDPDGFEPTVRHLLEEIQGVYLSDSIPWVVGYSGGKDSTAVLQLVWLALRGIPAEKRQKPVYVISTDTLVENPVVAEWVTRSLDKIGVAAKEEGLPIQPNRLTPEVSDSFWVNLIGRGYPAPRPKFRWCTLRLKIKPSNAFISRVVKENGEAIVVLGTRKAESSRRSATMTALEKRRYRERLSPNTSLPASLVYSPIEDWSNDEVWMFLMQIHNPWGYDNKALLAMYSGASTDGECPLVIDASTPSCGDSRFGCWVCTLVDKDKSMQAMIQNDAEKEWMLPLLCFRNDLDVADDRHLRDFRRITGRVQLFHDRPIPGPYTQKVRERWLRQLLQAQVFVRRHAPPTQQATEIITFAELEEIRRIWVVEKHEIEDHLPFIFSDVMGQPYPGGRVDDASTFGAEEIGILGEICGEGSLHFQLTRELLDIERKYRSMTRRAGLFDELESAITRHFYEDEEDAVERARKVHDAKAISDDDTGEVGAI